MFWSTVNIEVLSKQFLPTFFRKAQATAHNEAFLSPLQKLADDTLYKMQHNGTKIYLEKMLNEAYNVPGYDNQDHEGTKLIYIDDIEQEEKLFIWQNEEEGTSFLEDDDDPNEDDVFLVDEEGEAGSASWTIFMPDTISFQELTLRALVDSYRYIGKKYNVEIYTP
ncbi:MAG: hypothetical protein C0525_01310 [Flavobacterium sp.]|uniref:hypothetical protein n=1 Tax=Flavobacterium sp. TaxID=239 RepID=UPI0025C6A6D1|nr:hypothetical protein [Flavobacterium sp.]MBA4133339.1 hypothetical protein [Flavobacterium sp.]